SGSRRSLLKTFRSLRPTGQAGPATVQVGPKQLVARAPPSCNGRLDRGRVCLRPRRGRDVGGKRAPTRRKAAAATTCSGTFGPCIGKGRWCASTLTVAFPSTP